MKGCSEKTFRDLDGDMALPTPDSVLEVWYESIRDVKICDLDVFDIARAVRQRQHVEDVVPCALRHILADPLAGSMDDGEIIFALKGLPAEYWGAHREQLKTLIEQADTAYEVYADDDRLILLAGELLGE